MSFVENGVRQYRHNQQVSQPGWGFWFLRVFWSVTKFFFSLAWKWRVSAGYAVLIALALGLFSVGSGGASFWGVLFLLIPVAMVAGAFWKPELLRKHAPILADWDRIQAKRLHNREMYAAGEYLDEVRLLSWDAIEQMGYVPGLLMEGPNGVRKLYLPNGLPGRSFAEILSVARARASVMDAVYVTGDHSADKEISIHFHRTDPRPPELLAGHQFLRQMKIVGEDEVEESNVTLHNLGDKKVLTVKSALPGVPRKTLQSRVEEFADTLDAVRVVSRSLGRGAEQYTMFLTDPLDEVYKRETIGELDVDKMEVVSAVDSFGNEISVKLSGQSGMVVGGVPGSGKTAGVTSFLTPMALSRYVNLTVIDGKGSGDWGSYEAVADKFLDGTDDLTEARDVVLALHDRMRERQRTIRESLGTSNFWNASAEERLEAGMKLELLVIDECQDVFDTGGRSADEKKMMGEITRYVSALVKKGRSAGFFVILMTQKPTADSIPPAIRDNCGIRISFRVMTGVAVNAVMGEAPDFGVTLPTRIPASRVGGAVMADEGGNWTDVRFFYIPEEVQGRLLVPEDSEVVLDEGPDLGELDAVDEVSDGDWGYSPVPAVSAGSDGR